MAIILNLSGTLPETVTAGNWPLSAFNNAKWRFTWVPTAASTASPWNATGTTYWCLFSSNDAGGLWIFTNGSTISLGYFGQASGSPIFERAITWSAGQAITITIDNAAQQVTISGASTGNGVYGYTRVDAFSNTLLGVGRYAGGAGYDLPSSTISDVDDAAAEISLASWRPSFPDRVVRKSLAVAAMMAFVAPVITPPAAPAPEMSWEPTYPDRVPAKPAPVNTGGLFASSPLPITTAVVPSLSWAPSYPDSTRDPPRPVIEGRVFAPVVTLNGFYKNSAAGGDTAGSTDRAASITPVQGDLLIAFVSISGNTNTAMTMTDDQGGTYHQVGTALWGTSANIGGVFVRNSLCSTTLLHTLTCVSGANTAGEVVIVSIGGMRRVGEDAVRSFGSQANQAAASIPAPALNQNALFTNITLVGVASGDVTTSPPTNWVNRQDVNQATPTTALEVATRDFGFQGTSITFGAAQSTTYASFALELHGSDNVDDFNWRSVYPDRHTYVLPIGEGILTQPPFDTSSPPPVTEYWYPVCPDFARSAQRTPWLLPAATYVPSGAGSPLTVGKAHAHQRVFGISPQTGTWTTPSTNITISSVDHTTDTFTATAHGMTVCDGPYRLSTTGTYPAGVDGDTNYYVDVETANTFKLSTSATNAKNNTNVAISSNGTGTLTLVRTIDTDAVGSTFLVFAARGYWNLDPSAPTDSFGNSLTPIAGSPRYYSTYPSSATWVGYKVNAKGGSLHTFSASFVNFDEPTVGGLALYGVTELADASHVERTGAATITSASVTVTRRALLIAQIWGSGVTGQDHTWTFHNGFTKIPQASDEGDVSSNGYVQVATAYRVVEAGTYTVSASGINNEGGQMYLMAFYGPVVETAPTSSPDLPWNLGVLETPLRIVRRPLGGVTSPPTDTNAGPLTWLPVVVDIARGSRRNPFGGLVEPPHDTGAGPLTWVPSYPDFAKRLPRICEVLWVDPLTDTNAGPLTWGPVFPDTVSRVAVKTEGLQTGPLFDSNAGPLTWSPDYTDIVPPGLIRTEGLWAGPLTDTNAGPLTWLPSFPDFPRREARSRLSGYVYAPLTDFNDGPLTWLPSFPDSIIPKNRGILEEVAKPLVSTVVAPLSWDPEFPDLTRRPLRNLLGGSAGPILPPRPPELSWAPSFPDFVLAARCPLNDGGSFSPPPLPAPNEPSPVRAWAPNYDDFARAAARPVNTGGSFAPNPLPLPNPPAPELSWAPHYPSLLHPVSRSILENLFEPLLLKQDLSWLPIYQDLVFASFRQSLGGSVEPLYLAQSFGWLSQNSGYVFRELVRPLGFETTPPIEPNLVTVYWHPSYPDIIWRNRLIEGVSLLYPLPIPTPPSPELAWGPEYPDFARASRRPVNVGGMHAPPTEIPDVPFEQGLDAGPILSASLVSLGPSLTVRRHSSTLGLTIRIKKS